MLKASLQLRLGQQLTMTPQLQQAIRLLQLPSLELQAHIRELLETNVMLEAEEDSEATAQLRGAGRRPQRPRSHRRRRDAQAAASESDGDSDSSGESAEPSVEIVEDSWNETSAAPGETPWSGDDDDRQQECQDGRGEIAARAPAVAAGDGQAGRARARHRPRHHRCHQRRWLPHRPIRRHRRHPEARDPGRATRKSPTMLEVVQTLRSRSASAARNRRRMPDAAAARAGIRTRPASPPRWPSRQDHLDLVAQPRTGHAAARTAALRRGTGAGAGAGARLPSAPGLADQLRRRRIRGAGCVRAPHGGVAGPWR